MSVASIKVRALHIPFKAAFRHASAARSTTQTVWAEARDDSGNAGVGEGCPREYVTAESLDSALSFAESTAGKWIGTPLDLNAIRDWTSRREAAIDANPAAWTAIELALLDLLGKRQGQPLEALLGLPPASGQLQYTAVIGDGAPAEFEAVLARYIKAGFGQFKIKLSGDRERDGAKIKALRAVGVDPASVRADANNLWRDADEAIAGLSVLDFGFYAVEEPLTAGDYEGMLRLAEALDTRIVLDESLLRIAQVQALDGAGERWVANLRVSKAGGLIRALELVEALRAKSIPIIIGAHVGETSVLARAALAVSAAAGPLVVAREGAFGTYLLEQDVADPPVMFGVGGILDVDAPGFGARPGLGLSLRPSSEID
jgi:L-alanine-DL-glutamate epimerase-like enolase superfamily enzyme